MTEQPTYEELVQRIRDMEKTELDRKRAKAAFQEIETANKALLEGLPASVIIIDPATRIIESVNKATEALFGAPKERIIGHRCHSFLCPADDGACPICDLGQEVDNSEREMICADGSRRQVVKSVKRIQLQGHERLLECFVDISERKHAEKALKENEEKFRQLFEATNDAIFVHLLDEDGSPGRFIEANDIACRRLGYTKEELSKLTPIEIGSSTSKTNPARIVEILKNNGDSLFETVHVSKDGRQIPVESHVRLFDFRGKKAVLSISRDITKRKQTETVLRERERYLRTILETTQDGFWVLDAQGNVIDVNDAYCRMSGYSRDELLTLRISDLDAVEMPEQTAARIKRIVENGSELFEARHRRKDGSVFDVELSVTWLDSDIGKFVCFCRDITERKQIEASRAFLLQCGLPGTGEDFFASLARHLAETLGTEYVCIDRLEGDGLTARTVAVYNNGKFESNVSYALKDTPCGEVVNNRICCYPRGVRRLFPRDLVLQELKAESYFGTTLWDSRGQPIGLIAVIGQQVLNDSKRAQTLLNLVAPRAAGELERRQTEEALRESEETVRKKLRTIVEPEGDIGVLNLGDIIDHQALQSMLEDFYRLTKIGSAVLDLSGKVLVAVGWQDACTKFHRCHPDTLNNCLESDTILSSGVPAGTFKAYRCKNNLWDIVTPIEVGGRHLGNIFLGQFFYADEVPDYALFRRQARQYGFDEAEYLAAIDRVPRWSRDTVDSAMAFYAKLAGMISSLSHGTVKLARAVSQQEAALRRLGESEEAHRTLVECLPDIVMRFDRQGHHLFVSENVSEVVDFRATQFIGKTHRELGFPEGQCRVWEETIQRVFDGGAPLETEFTFEGKQGLSIYNCRLIPERNAQDAVQSVLSLIRDITAARKAERDYQTLFNEMLDGFALHEIICDGQGQPVDYRFLAVNPAFEKMTGLKAARIVGRTVREVMPGTEQNWIETYGRVALTGEPAFFENDSKVLDKCFEVTAFRPAPNQFACIFADITERKRADEALLRSEKDLKESQRIAHLGSWHLDVATNQVVWSDELYKMYGFDPALPPPPYTEHMKLFTPQSWERLSTALAKTRDTGIPYELELETVWQDGGKGWMWVRGEVEVDSKGKTLGLWGAAQDITERKRDEVEREKLYAQLNQAQKMESVGRLAGGVAHDFNNMLSVILGHTDMALEQVDEALPLYADLEEIRKAGQRSADLTRQLLAFARKQTIAPKVLDLNRTVESMLVMLRRLIGEDIDLSWTPGKNLWPIKMDPSQIDQILANLCVNARDAIVGVGKVTIETENTAFDEAYCADHAGFTPGEYVRLAFSDNGCGMDPETLAHLYEPFFTTKAMGKGTGLGLATLYGIVKQNNGFINTYSEPGRGTTFKIYLPRQTDCAEQLHKKGPEEPDVRGSETILLVEDEPAILRMTTMMLERLGYVVVAARTPNEAIRLSRDYGGEIHLLMTDVIMPETNGRELARGIMSRYPILKCLFMSGYTANVIAHHGVLDQGVNFIQKPFSKKDLAIKLREVLEGESAM